MKNPSLSRRYGPPLLSLACFALTVCLLSGLGRALFSSPSPVSATEQAAPTVVLDPGHGGEDCGAVGVDGTLEKDLNLQIAQRLRSLLTACGVTVVMTREEDVLLYDPSSDYRGQKKVQDLANRRRIAEQHENAIFVSIHMNAFPDAKYKGLQVYYSQNHPDSRTLAEGIQRGTKTHLQPENNRKIKPSGSSIYLLEKLHCPAVLIECGFLSHPEECARLSDENNQQALALIIGIAILENLSPDGT